MEETQKPLICSVGGCSMRFTHEDNLSLHMKKHDMVLNFGNGQKTNVFVADQTPTPTRFIRNCEEVGLFQDLQNVNPFEETFRKAVEASRVGGSHLEVHSLHIPASAADDTLHTPHVFPNITEEHSSISNLITSRSVAETPSGDKSESREELETLQVPTILHSEPAAVEVTDTTTDLETDIEISGLNSTEILVKQETDPLQQNPSSVVDSHNKIPLTIASTQDTVQVVFRMPDGRLVQLSGVSMDSVPSTQLPVQVPSTIVQAAPLTHSTTAPSTVIINTQLVQNAARIAQVSTGGQSNIVAAPSSSIPVSSALTTADNVNSPQARLSAAKMKLKQRIQFNSKRKQSSSDIESNLSSQKKGPAQRSRATSSEGSDTSASASPRAKRNSNPTSDVDEQKQRFRERNRAAAMRCREKRKHWILELEKRADETQRVNQQLTAEVAKLRNELVQLKTLLLAHKDCSVTKAMQQGVGIAIPRHANAVKASAVCQLQTQTQQSIVTVPQEPLSIPGNINVCASPEDSHPKVVLLSKPAGLKRRRQASLAALAVVENGNVNSKDLQVQLNVAHKVNVSPSISAPPVSSLIQEMSKNCQPEELKPNIMSDSVNTSPSTCVITVAASSLLSGVSAQPVALKSGSLTSTSYLMPTKLCLSTNDTNLPRIIKLNSNILKTGTSDHKKANNIAHSSGDSMDSGHGSDIEILAEIPNKPESKS